MNGPGYSLVGAPQGCWWSKTNVPCTPAAAPDPPEAPVWDFVGALSTPQQPPVDSPWKQSRGAPLPRAFTCMMDTGETVGGGQTRPEGAKGMVVLIQEFCKGRETWGLRIRKKERGGGGAKRCQQGAPGPYHSSVYCFMSIS